ncbi:MAG: hypothetical protein HYV03_06070 [Deltaproteobacteria bacterium]|nr:hypothetical protein [Deltaproteobacteria bacterium]
MKKSAAVKSSFSLPPQEVSLVNRLKKRLHVHTNTAVVRLALLDLQKKVEREELRKQFLEASQIVRTANRQEMVSLDRLAGEGLGED